MRIGGEKMEYINQALVVAAGVMTADILKSLAQLISDKIKSKRTNINSTAGLWIHKK